MHLRITLTNLQHIPTREEISSSERRFGEKYFEPFNLEWAGWIVLDDTFKLSAQWLADFSLQEDLLCHIERNEFPGYEVGVWQIDDSQESDIRLV